VTFHATNVRATGRGAGHTCVCALCVCVCVCVCVYGARGACRASVLICAVYWWGSNTL
jgi:hypothetical protein